MHRPLLAAGVLTLALAVPAGAVSGTYTTRTVTEPADPGLEVTGALSDYRVTSRARVLVPTSWKRLSAAPGQLRFRNTQNASCRFTVSYRATSVLAPTGTAADRVAAGLPAAGSRYVLDSGTRGNRAFRVIRRRSTDGRARVAALWTGVLTRRSDIAPAGQAAWSEIHVSAISGKGDECHSGTWRQALGPTIGDSLAVAHATLRFTRER